MNEMTNTCLYCTKEYLVRSGCRCYEAREAKLQRSGDSKPPCDLCNDGTYMTFPLRCRCGR